MSPMDAPAGMKTASRRFVGLAVLCVLSAGAVCAAWRIRQARQKTPGVERPPMTRYVSPDGRTSFMYPAGLAVNELRGLDDSGTVVYDASGTLEIAGRLERLEIGVTKPLSSPTDVDEACSQPRRVPLPSGHGCYWLFDVDWRGIRIEGAEDRPEPRSFYVSASLDRILPISETATRAELQAIGETVAASLQFRT